MNKSIKNREDGSPVYRKEIRINGKRLTKVFTRSADADRWYSQKKREKELIESGAQPVIEETVFKDFVDTWMADRSQQGKPLGSWLSDLERLRKWILPAFGNRVLHKISAKELESFLDGLVAKNGLAPATRNRIRSVLHKLYNDALRKDLVLANPVSKCLVWKEKGQKFDFLKTEEELGIYLKAAQTEYKVFRVFAILALNTGARIGELIALRHEDCDLQNRRIHIFKTKELRNREIVERTKGGSARWLGMNDECFEVLKEHRQTSKFGKPGDFILHRADGESIDARTLRDAHMRVCKKAGLRHIRVHDLRHTFASHFVMNGGSLNDLQAILGHSSPQMTQAYAHLAPGYLQSKAGVVRIGKDLCHTGATFERKSVLKLVR